MGLGRQGDQQGTMFLAYNEIPRSRGHAFYDRLQQILRRSGFDACAEKLRQPFHSGKGRPWIPPGRYFRMRLVGYSEGIDSERGITWRCAASLSLLPADGIGGGQAENPPSQRAVRPDASSRPGESAGRQPRGAQSENRRAKQVS